VSIKAALEKSRWESLMQSVEGPYASAVFDEKNRYIAESATVFRSTSRLEDKLFDYHRAAMLEIAMRYQGIAIRIALVEAVKQVKALQAKADWDKLWLYLLRKWMTDYGFQAAKETAQTTRDDMQKIIDTALSHDTEFNPVAVASSLLQARDLSAPRAETIARTETHNAMMFASVEGANSVAREDGLVLNKKWVPVQDGRSRVSHAAMASHPAIAMDAEFNVGGYKMSRPGDPRGGAANCINCRCVLVFEVVE
jgi:hypothetical protein